ncbi:MAG: hypothetical protein IKS17_09975 [Firmicutes bacterium]|nr:hypothetical protein [Bacillota bacterium]
MTEMKFFTLFLRVYFGVVNIASGEPFGENGIVKITNSQYTPIQASPSQFTGSIPQTPMFSFGKIQMIAYCVALYYSRIHSV